MACPKTKRIRGRDWPFFRRGSQQTCIYTVETATSDEAADVVAAAQAMPGYVKRSQFYEVEDGVRVYIHFEET